MAWVVRCGLAKSHSHSQSFVRCHLRALIRHREGTPTGSHMHYHGKPSPETKRTGSWVSHPGSLEFTWLQRFKILSSFGLTHAWGCSTFFERPEPRSPDQFPSPCSCDSNMASRLALVIMQSTHVATFFARSPRLVS
jgi:hypothetical protein